MPLCLMWCSCSCSQQPLIGCRLLPLWCCLLTSANNRSLVPQCLSASCGALALACSQQPLIGCRLLLLPLWCCSHRQSACSQQPLIGCRLLLLPLWCCASLACSHRLAFSSISIINNRSLVRLNVSLPHVVLLLLLAANSRSLVVGCCCCLSGVACSLHPLIGASMSLCLMRYSCSCSQQPLIGCRLLLLPLWCCSHKL